MKDETGFISPIIKTQLRRAVVEELGRKGFYATGFAAGFVDDPAEADLELALTLNTRRELQSFEIDANQCDDCWEVISPGGNSRFTLRTVGFLTADVYSAGEPVWHGWVERNLYPAERDRAPEVLAAAIPRLFENFPPR